MTWISVEERLPDNSHEVLALNDGMICVAVCYFGEERVWDSRDYNFMASAVTHWMPLPPLPEAK